MKINLLIFCLLASITTVAYAQKGPEVGAMAGLTYYFGDLNPNVDIGHPGIAVSILGRYNFNKRLAAKLSLSYGRISGDDSRSDNNFQQARNLDFRSNVWDMAAQMEFNFFPYEHWSYENWFTPYVFGGFSVFRVNPKTDLQGETYELREWGTEGQQIGDEYLKINPAVVYGLGMKWNIDRVWTINLEISGRALFTDYIDDVSGTYPNKLELEDLRGPTAVALSDRSIPDLNDFQLGEEGRQRGNSKDNDSFNFITIGVTYFLGQVACPAISRPDRN